MDVGDVPPARQKRAHHQNEQWYTHTAETMAPPCVQERDHHLNEVAGCEEYEEEGGQVAAIDVVEASVEVGDAPLGAK